jgi:hypothetical protein
MSRSKHHTNRGRQPWQRKHPYWRFGWAYKHGPKDVRQHLEASHRAKVKQSLHHGEDPPERPMDAAWIWW